MKGVNRFKCPQETLREWKTFNQTAYLFFNSM